LTGTTFFMSPPECLRQAGSNGPDVEKFNQPGGHRP